MSDPYEFEKLPYLDDFIQAWGVQFSFVTLLATLYVLRRSPRPIAFAISFSAPGFLLQSAAIAGKAGMAMAGGIPPTTSAIDAMLVVLALVFVSYVYLFNWVPFFVFIWGSLLLLMRRPRSKSVAAQISWPHVIMTAVVALSYPFTWKNLDQMYAWGH